MIAGLFITYFKTYSKINFVPLSDGHNLCGILGKNGIGKSSILEALDYFFNRDKEWNLHLNAKKKGVTSKRDGAANPYILPIFIIDKDEAIRADLLSVLVELDRLFRCIKKEDINGMGNNAKSTFLSLKDSICSKDIYSSKLIIPIGINYDNIAICPIIDSIKSDIITTDALESVIKYIRDLYDYVYIPKDIDTEQFMKLETKQVQMLMGESLEDILKSKITETTIREINGNLDKFISDLENELNGYVYKTIQHRQSKVKRSDIYKLIIDTYFNVRKLHKKIKDDQTIPMSEMSSGEKQKAIIDVAHSLLKNHRVDGKNLILGIDEPEASLHISACFDQFNSLFDIGNDCRQVLFTSHWYGYLPILNNGNTCIISKLDGTHRFDLINTSNYQEQMSQQKEESRGKLPYDIQLKSTTDFVQSILINVFSDSPYNWIICEGSSEKIYFEKYFEDEINLNKLRIVPVGGAKKIKKVYSNILIPYNEMKDSVGKNINRGKILLLSDTDRSLVSYKVEGDDFFKCQRIVNDPKTKETLMVNIHENPISPETEIEDCLNGRLFVEVLKYFRDDFPIIDFIDDKKIYLESPSVFSLDLRHSEQDKLKNFFDHDNGKVKLQFAKKYVELLSNSYDIPKWIRDIKQWINS
ncbi:hypothetical protein BKK54_02540 [Rodentibacter genomosp. 1]|uniref:Endonuclease GajA/Old nuclease/RecF-like AAA domain-containing protein n=1 Tax=Rodentibacter genomosp. 1 TaxID=1908264 RepID=A0A1V3J8E4_9PAST|nr:AAA family ATPase [Rodentibacter genomosp. 1]OOF51502.1 hypothetical protein BKK54_02540 [Rodentibacter genomosp. 1]